MAAEDYSSDDAVDSYDESDAEHRFILVEIHPKHVKSPNGTNERGGTPLFHEFDTRHPYADEALVTVGPLVRDPKTRKLRFARRVVKVYPTARVNEAIGSQLLRRVDNAPESPRPPDVAELLDEGRRQALEIDRSQQLAQLVRDRAENRETVTPADSSAATASASADSSDDADTSSEDDSAATPKSAKRSR